MSLTYCNLRSANLMRCAKEIWERDSSTEGAQMVEDRNFGNSLDTRQWLSFQCGGNYHKLRKFLLVENPKTCYGLSFLWRCIKRKGLYVIFSRLGQRFYRSYCGSRIRCCKLLFYFLFCIFVYLLKLLFSLRFFSTIRWKVT